MNLDRWIALIFLILSLAYGLAAFRYPLLPFERNMAFLPNTLPISLSFLGVTISLFILLSAKSTAEIDPEKLSVAQFRHFKSGQAMGLIVAMILYAVLLRPVGFLISTTLFIAGTSIVLGERKVHFLIPVALIAAISVWYLVQQTLGIYLRPWPDFPGG